MRRQPRGASRPREHDAQDVRMRVVGGDVPERQQLRRCSRSEPAADVTRFRRRPRERADGILEAAQRVPDLALEHELVVARGLDPHQQAIEGRDVDPRRLASTLQRLDERGPRARERIEDAAARRHVPRQQCLDELRDELPQVGMQPVDVLRPLALGQIALGPRELEVDVGVEGVLRPRHTDRSSDQAPTPGPRVAAAPDMRGRGAERSGVRALREGGSRGKPAVSPVHLGEPAVSVVLAQPRDPLLERRVGREQRRHADTA